MESIVQYSVNIAMEGTIILILFVLLITCFLQKNFLSTAIPLIFLSSSIILSLTVQIITWILFIRNVPTEYGANPMRIVYIFDYIFTYCTSIAFYYYISSLIKDGYEYIGVKYRPKKYIKNVILIWGLLTSLMYAVIIYVPAIYHVENGVAVYSIPAYVCMHIMVKFAYVCTLSMIIKHRKVIGKTEATLSFIFVILESVFIIVDELCGLCISYVLQSLFAFILYICIDLHKGLLLERQEKEIVEWKTQIMLSQMRPHFLYNVLTTISSMCEMQNAIQARDVVNRFADYFRTNIDSLGKEKTIPFEKEFEHIKTYLWLEKIRFEDALNICYEIGPIDFEVPSLAIQPIVENAVKHGILPKDDGGTITIRTLENKEYYAIIIEDDGVGFDVNEQQNDNHTHVGIENVSKRLEIICKGSLDVESESGKGTVVTIHIPKGERI